MHPDDATFNARDDYRFTDADYGGTAPKAKAKRVEFWCGFVVCFHSPFRELSKGREGRRVSPSCGFRLLKQPSLPARVGA